MDFSSKNKDFLTALADHLGIEVESEGRKPNKDELIAALEAAEKEDPELITLAVKELEEGDDEEEEEDDQQEEENEQADEVKKSYGYKKGDKDPTTYGPGDPLYGHVDGPRHREWKKVNG